jgi:hypothetical protein
VASVASSAGGEQQSVTLQTLKEPTDALALLSRLQNLTLSGGGPEGGEQNSGVPEDSRRAHAPLHLALPSRGRCHHWPHPWERKAATHVTCGSRPRALPAWVPSDGVCARAPQGAASASASTAVASSRRSDAAPSVSRPRVSDGKLTVLTEARAGWQVRPGLHASHQSHTIHL